MSNYDENKKINELDIETTIAQNDYVIFGDVSASPVSKAKAILQSLYEKTIALSQNFATWILQNVDFLTGLADNATFIDELANNTDFIDELTQNSQFQQNVNNFVSGGSGGSTGFGGKPVSFQLIPDTNDCVALNGFQDQEAQVFKITATSATIVVRDPNGSSQSRDITTDWALATDILGYVLQASYLYVMVVNSTTTARIYRYDISDLSAGGTLMTISGGPGFVWNSAVAGSKQNFTSNGSNFFFNYGSGSSNDSYVIDKYSLSGTTLTYASSKTLGSTADTFVTWAVTNDGHYISLGETTDNVISYDSAGNLDYTSGYIKSDSGNQKMLNWSNTIYYSLIQGGANTFVKMYLPNTSDEGVVDGVSFVGLAEEDLTAGVSVGVSNDIARHIATASTTHYAATITPTMQQSKCVEIGTDKVAFIYQETSSGDLKVVVATVDRSDMGNAFTFGTEQTLSADLINDFVFDICKLDTDKFAVVYGESAANTKVRFRACTVSGTTITLGAETDVMTLAGVIDGVAIDELAVDTAAVAGFETTGNTTKAAIVTVSGTTPTAGTAVSLNAALDNPVLMVRKIATNKFAVTSAGYIQIGTVSGTTITMGTQVQYASVYSGNREFDDIINPADDVLVVRWFTNVGSLANIRAATVSGTTPTFGTAVVPPQTSGGGLYPISATSVLVLEKQTSGGTVLSRRTLSGNTLGSQVSIASLGNNLNSGAPAQPLVNMGSYYIAVAPNATTLDYFIKGMATGDIGVVQSNVSRGGNAAVLLVGIDRTQTDLVPGLSTNISTTERFIN